MKLLFLVMANLMLQLGRLVRVLLWLAIGGALLLLNFSLFVKVFPAGFICWYLARLVLFVCCLLLLFMGVCLPLGISIDH
jgi:hypothetical protein